MNGKLAHALHWGTLVVLSLLIVIGLELLRFPAALLLGSMVAAVLFAMRDVDLRVLPLLFNGAQAVIGCMIARAFPLSTYVEMGHHWAIFLGGAMSVIAAAALLGWLLTLGKVLPGSTAIWGIFPGAAMVMILTAENVGADARLVAFMQYLRIAVVAVVASVIGRLFTPSGNGAAWHLDWFPDPDWPSFGATATLLVVCAVAGQRLRIPAGPLMLPMAVGVALQDAGFLKIELPPSLLAIAYLLVGWSIGLRFNRRILTYAARAFGRVLASLLALVASCAAFAGVLVAIADVDPLTAYLATSPGGVDAIAIIAASSKVDMPFILAMQTARFILVLFMGAVMVRFLKETDA
jgi:membrane AbrB-like protein